MRTSRGMKVAGALFLAPALLMLLLFLIVPAVWAACISFTDRALAGEKAVQPSFVGLANYARLFTDPAFYHSLFLSVRFVLATLATQFVLGMFAAFLLANRGVRAKGFFTSAIVLPMVLPEVVQALIWSGMLSNSGMGTMNRLIGLLGLGPVNWLRIAPLASIVLINLWGGMGTALIFFLAGRESVPEELLEAAAMDGADAWQKLTRITLPLMRYVILLWMLLTTLGTFGTFGWVFTLTRGGPAGATELIGIYLYQESFKYFQLGYGSAAAIVLLAICLCFGLVYVRLLRVKL
jgi:multiple sugar transport system permease protein